MWLEGWARGLLAKLRKQTDAAACYGELRGLVGDVLHDRDAAADRRIRYAAGFLAAGSAVNDGKTAEG